MGGGGVGGGGLFSSFYGFFVVELVVLELSDYHKAGRVFTHE